MVAPLLFGHKSSKLQVDLGDLEGQSENLATFLRAHLKVDSVPKQNKLLIQPETTETAELQRVVTKFIYHQNLNVSHWVSVDGKTVKINRFKGVKKPDKTEKHEKKKNAPHQTLPQSWGL